MDSDKKVNWGRVLILAGAVIAFTIGSGFATGQEIIQYYTAYGVQGIFTVLLFASSTTITTLPRPEQRSTLKKEMTYISFTAVNTLGPSWIIILLYFVTCHFSLWLEVLPLH